MLVTIQRLGFLVTSCAVVLSCSSTPNHPLPTERAVETFNLIENNNTLFIEKETGFVKKKNEFVVKQQIFENKNLAKGGKALERIITVSTLGSLNKKVNVLRPKISQYQVWFEGKKHFTETKIDVTKRSLEVKSEGPEDKWNSKKTFPFPQGTGVFCYFSQVIECLAVTGFIKLAQDKKTGTINFHIIWESYPFIQEHYSNMTPEVFSEAQMTYDGDTEEKETRFALQVGNQNIVYMLDKNNKLSRMFWVAQGVSQIKYSQNKAESKDNSEKGEDLFDTTQIH